MNLGGELSYWRSASKQEIDFVWTRGDCAIGFDIKASSTWRREYGSAIRDLIAKRKLLGGYVIYAGESLTNEQGVTVLSVSQFLQKLWNGEILVEGGS
jgi:predicted AAA+ superfamily ATPase